MRQSVVSFFVGLMTLVACTHSDAGQKKAGPLGSPEVVFETTKGSFTIKLNGDKAPISTRNFLSYVDSGFYNGTIFHRIIPDFMIQGGGFTKDLDHKPTDNPIKNEADNGLLNKRGTVAMARTNEVDSATSQFFINVKDNRQLDHTGSNFGYAVIGEVVSGMDVVDTIREVKTRCPSWTGEPCLEKMPAGMRDVPVEPIVITKAYRK